MFFEKLFPTISSFGKNKILGQVVSLVNNNKPLSVSGRNACLVHPENKLLGADME